MKILNKKYPSTTPVVISVSDYLGKTGKDATDISEASYTITREENEGDNLVSKDLDSGLTLNTSNKTITVAFTEADYEFIYEGEPYYQNLQLKFTGNSYFEYADIQFQKIIFQDVDRKGITTYKTLAQQVMRLLSAGTKTVDSKLDQRVVIRHVRQAAAKRITGEWRQMQADGEKMVIERYLATYNGVEVRYDETREKYYSSIPDNYIPIYNGAGVQQVVPMTGEEDIDVAMIPIRPFDMELYKTLPAGKLEDQWSYEIDRNRIWYNSVWPKTDKEVTVGDRGIKKVRMTVISVDAQSVKDTDPWPVPPDMENDLIMEVLALYGYTGQEVRDMIANTNPQA